MKQSVKQRASSPLFGNAPGGLLKSRFPYLVFVSAPAKKEERKKKKRKRHRRHRTETRLCVFMALTMKVNRHPPVVSLLNASPMRWQLVRGP